MLLKPVSVDMLICVHKVGQSARESTREMNVDSLCSLPARKGAEVSVFSFLLLPSSFKSSIIFMLVLQEHELDKGMGRRTEKSRAIRNALGRVQNRPRDKHRV